MIAPRYWPGGKQNAKQLARFTSRHYDAPQTPLERVRRCPQVDLAKVAALVRQRDRLDPFVLAARIDGQLAQVYALANHRRGLVPSTLGGATMRRSVTLTYGSTRIQHFPHGI